MSDFITRYNGLSKLGATTQELFSSDVGRANNQIELLKASKNYSPNEKKQIAMQGAATTKKAIEGKLEALMDNIVYRKSKIRSDVSNVIKTDWDDSTRAIIAIELAKDGKRAIDALTDRNMLAALSKFPEKITNLSPETIQNARNSYVITNHPDIAADQEQVRADLLLVDSMLKHNETLAAEYEKFSTVEVETLTI